MRKPDKRILTALCNLEANPDYRIVLEWIVESSNDLDTTLRQSDNQVALFRAQGALKELHGLSSYSSNPRELAGKLAMQQAGVSIDS